MTCPNCGEVREVGVNEVRCYDAVVTPEGKIAKTESEEYPGSAWMEIYCSKCGELLETRNLQGGGSYALHRRSQGSMGTAG